VVEIDRAIQAKPIKHYAGEAETGFGAEKNLFGRRRGRACGKPGRLHYEARPKPRARRDWTFVQSVFVVLQTKLELMMSFVDCPNGLDAMSAEVMRGMLKVVFCVLQRPHGRADLGMSLSGRWRCRRQCEEQPEHRQTSPSTVFLSSCLRKWFRLELA
jgi:hypothetical protein